MTCHVSVSLVSITGPRPCPSSQLNLSRAVTDVECAEGAVAKFSAKTDDATNTGPFTWNSNDTTGHIALQPGGSNNSECTVMFVSCNHNTTPHTNGQSDLICSAPSCDSSTVHITIDPPILPPGSPRINQVQPQDGLIGVVNDPVRCTANVTADLPMRCLWSVSGGGLWEDTWERTTHAQQPTLRLTQAGDDWSLELVVGNENGSARREIKFKVGQ